MMGRNWLLVFFVLTMVSIAAVSGQSCEPNCTGHAAGDEVEDPKNCSRYFICMAGEVPTDQPVSCPEGHEFDPGNGCIPAYGCKPTCASSGGCHLTCIRDEEFVADPFNCSVFYECNVNGPGPALACPASIPHFDGSGCVKDESVCCKPSCDPYCDELVIQVPDPTDCTRYYMCIHGSLSEPLQCDPGEIFDYGIGHCSASGVCRVWCSGGISTPVVPDTTTSVVPDTTTPVVPDTTTPVVPDTTTPITPDDCLTEFLCEKPGLFQKCPYCYPYYFSCKTAGQLAFLERCTNDLEFNPVPGHAYCVLPENCPYCSTDEGCRQYSSVSKVQGKN